jgi:hypothetical protein
MLYLQDRCMKETVGQYEISVAFEKHGFGNLSVFDNENNQNVTHSVFGVGDDEVDATIDNMFLAKCWCEINAQIARM